MEPKHISLKLFLDRLGISDSISTIDDRKRVQKAVYLGQRSGVNLGYRFGWYLKGPYSTGLTQDYYALAQAVQDGDCEYADCELVDAANERLDRIVPLMTPPADVGLKQEDWLELVASVDYLKRVRGLSDSQAQDTLKREKPTLVAFFDQAVSALETAGLAKAS